MVNIKNIEEATLFQNANALYEELENYVGGLLDYHELDNIADKYGWQFIGESRDGTKIILIESPMGRQIDLIVGTVYDPNIADRIEDMVYVYEVEKRFW